MKPFLQGRHWRFGAEKMTDASNRRWLTDTGFIDRMAIFGASVDFPGARKSPN